MNRNIQLIVADIDGTAVDEDRHMMPITREAVQHLHNEKHIQFGVATGRPLGPVMYQIPHKWGLGFDADMFIGMNGGHLYNKEPHFFESFNELEPDVLKEIIDLMSQFHVNPFVYEGENLLVMDIDPYMDRATRIHNISLNIADNIEDLYKESRPNILFRLYDDESIEKVEAFTSQLHSDIYRAFKTQANLIEFQDKRLNKGEALKEYSKRFHVPLENIMVFGDMSNDNEIIEVAGVGVCMKNGAEDTKARADLITEYTNEEDGMGRFLKEYFSLK